MKKIIWVSSVFVTVLIMIFGIGVYKFKFAINNSSILDITSASPKDATYKIDGKYVALNNGVSEAEAAPDSASKIITRYFGNEVRHDFDGDGREDVAFLLTQQSGGSGTFFYVVAALNTAKGYVGSDAVLLGDRVAPQSTVMGSGNVIVVNYADRKPGEPFAVQPSAGKSIWLLLDPKTMQFGEVAQNFEGEADPARMTLGMKTWEWVSTSYSNGTKKIPYDSKKFIVTFKDNGTFSATTDCNSMGGSYTVSKNKILFEQIASTLMFCEGSQEQDFLVMLGQVQSFFFTSRGKLVFDLKLDSGSSIFR